VVSCTNATHTPYTGDAFLARLVGELHDNFGIEHPTIQIETGDPSYSCPFIAENTV
jgi:cobalt-zinc-cadmium efflux system protein